jgi:hypothetical protein
MLDREASRNDLADLRRFVASRIGVEFYVQPETTATDTTTVAVAIDGEWIRRRVSSRPVVPVVGCSGRLRRGDARCVSDRPVRWPR